MGTHCSMSHLESDFLSTPRRSFSFGVRDTRCRDTENALLVLVHLGHGLSRQSQRILSKLDPNDLAFLTSLHATLLCDQKNNKINREKQRIYMSVRAPERPSWQW